jgi:hypothetical protein
VVRAGAGGAVDLVAGGMFFPTQMRWGPDGLYSTFFGVGEPGAGMIVRIATQPTPTALPNTGDGSCADLSPDECQ